MNFLAPWMLFGAAAVSVPIILHLFFRSRYRTVPWAAMKFLLTSIEQTSRRLKFQELLLLLLRCLVLAALALAMARPITTMARGTGRGDAVDAVILIDASYSMGAGDGAMSRFERVKEAAVSVIDKLPPHSTVQIVSAADRAEDVGPRSPSNLDQGKLLVKGLELTSLSSDLLPGAVLARKILDQGQLPNKEVYLFSDMQKLGWESQSAALVKELQEIKDKAEITLVRTGTRALRNAAIVGIAPQSGVPRPGERIAYSVLVRNTGTEDLTDVEVSLTTDPSAATDENKDRHETYTIGRIGPGETRAAPLAAKFDKPGLRTLSARLRHDDVPGDNRFDQVIPVREQVDILIVNGGANERDATQSSTYYLNHALFPVKDTEFTKYYLRFREVEPRLASPTVLPKTQLVFLVNVGVEGDKNPRRVQLPAAFIEELGPWVKQGGGLVIVPGDNTQPEAYTKAFGSLLPTAIEKTLTFDAQTAPHFNRKTFAFPPFLPFKDDARFAIFNLLLAPKTLKLAEPKSEGGASGEVILRYQNEMPAMARAKRDRGEVFLFATAAEPAWSDLGGFGGGAMLAAMMQTLVPHMLSEQTQNLNTVAGETITFHPTEKDLRTYTLEPPGGGEGIRLGVPTDINKQRTLALPVLTRAGIYRLLARSATQGAAPAATIEDRGVPLAVVPDLRESEDFESLSDAQIDSRLGFTPTHVNIGGAESDGTGLDRFQKEWTLWVLLLVLILAVAEATLAWFCGRAL